MRGQLTPMWRFCAPDPPARWLASQPSLAKSEAKRGLSLLTVLLLGSTLGAVLSVTVLLRRLASTTVEMHEAGQRVLAVEAQVSQAYLLQPLHAVCELTCTPGPSSRARSLNRQKPRLSLHTRRPQSTRSSWTR